MRSVLSAVCVLFAVFSAALASIPLTVNVPANDRTCYYVRAHRDDAKIHASFTVMSGGQFDIDATLTRPDNTVVQRVSRSGGDEWLLTAQQTGEFELCFSNEMSTFADKKVQFEFDIDTNAVTAQSPKAAGDDATYEMERYVTEIDQLASSISRRIYYLKMRNSRNESTVQSTTSRVWWFSVIELLAIVGMAVLNVTIVQFFFKGSRKNIV